MIDRESLGANRGPFPRDAVRERLVADWRRRPAVERNPIVADRFARDAAETFPFESERPRHVVILAWIRPWVITPPPERPQGPLRRWLERPWYHRGPWSLRLGGLAVLAFVLQRAWTHFEEGQPEFGAFWMLVSGPIVVILAALWTERRPGR